jgi:hypothetical protein
MIKLKELLDINYESVDLFSESPMRISKWSPDQLNGLGSNYTFTIGLKEKATHVGEFENKYQIYSYPFSKEIIDCFVNGDYTIAYFQYFPNSDNFIEINRIWQDPIHIGLNRSIIFNYYLNKYKGLITDNVHTELGEKSIKKLLKLALESNMKIYVLVDNKEKIQINNLSDVDNYYSDGPQGLKYRFVIEK